MRLGVGLELGAPGPETVIASAQLHARLYLVLPNEHRTSMDQYGHGLADALNTFAPGVRALTVTLPGAHRPTGFLKRSLQRYVEYPLAVRGSRADIHHIVDHSYGHLVRALDNNRTVATCHDLMLFKMQQGLVPRGRLSRRTLMTFAFSVANLKRCRMLIANSYNTRRDFAGYLGIDPDRIKVVYYGIPAHFRTPTAQEIHSAREHLHIDDSGHKTYVLNVSTGASYKNSEGSILALKYLLRQGIDDAYLIRVGTPLDAGQLRLAHSLGVRERITDFGPLPNEQMPWAYWAADALLFPSFYEGFGWPIIEAMACGTPVVCSNTPAVVEASGGIAAALPPEDAAGMAAALARLMCQRGLREDQIKRGLGWAREFSWNRTALETAQVYTDVTARSAPFRSTG